MIDSKKEAGKSLRFSGFLFFSLLYTYYKLICENNK